MPRQMVPWVWKPGERAPPLGLSPWGPLSVITAEQLFKQGAWGSSIFLTKCPPSLGPGRVGPPGAGALSGADSQPPRDCVKGAHRCQLQVEQGRAPPHTQGCEVGGSG